MEAVVTTRSQAKRSFLSGLEVTSKRVKKSGTLLRFQTHADIYRLILLLGDTAIADVRQRRPKLGYSHALQRHDAINTIVGSPDDNQPFRRRTNCDGVDFEYIVHDATLHLTVRYRKYQVRRNSDGNLVDCPSTYLSRLINRETVYREEERRVGDDGVDEADADDTVDNNAAWNDSARILAGAE